MSPFNKNLVGLLPAVLSGLLFTASVAPFDQWYLAYIALVPLLYVSREGSVGLTVLRYAVCGIIITTAWWYSVLAYSLLIFIGILIVMIASFSAWGLLSRRLLALRQGAFWNLFMPVFLWIGIERIHTSELVGIPGNLGITQYNQPLLIQSASLFGIYAVSFVVLLVNNTIAGWLYILRRRQAVAPAMVGATLLALLIAGGNFAYGHYRLKAYGNSEQESMIKVGLVQPVISSAMYLNGWRDPDVRGRMKEKLDTLTHAAVDAGVDIVFWPEGGNGYLNMRIAELRERLYRLATDHSLDLVISSNDIDPAGLKYNSIFTISNQGEFLDRYDKVRLIPGAEADYTAGAGFYPVRTSYGLLGPAICYESNFPSIMRRMAARGADFLFVSTSDVAFRKTALALSHANLSVFRAVENNRWLVHASNAGPSRVISPLGTVAAQSEMYEESILVAHIGSGGAAGFFTEAGYFVPLLLALLALGYLIVEGLLFLRVRFAGLRLEGRKPRKPVLTEDVIIMKAGLLTRNILSGAGLASTFVLLLAGLMVVSVVGMERTVGDERGLADAMEDFLHPGGELRPDKVTERFLQASKITCGPAVLAYVLSYYGMELTEHDLLGDLVVTAKGTSMLEMKRAVQKRGFESRGVSGNYAALRQLPLPVIAYINDSHYVVVNEVTDFQVSLFDPVIGHIRVSRNTFEQAWNGYMLLIAVKDIPERG